MQKGVKEYRYKSAEGFDVLVRSYKATGFAFAIKYDALGNVIIASARCSKSDKFSHSVGICKVMYRMEEEIYAIFPKGCLTLNPLVKGG